MLTAEQDQVRDPLAGTRPVETVEPPVAPRRRWTWIVGGVLGSLLLLLAFAPQLVAYSAWRHELPRSKFPGFREPIQVGRASLSWWGPVELWDIEYEAPGGAPFLTVAYSHESRTVWQMIFHPTEPFDVRIENPVLTVLCRPDGSNVEDALAPTRDQPRPPKREKTVAVTGGVVRATDTTTGRSVEWTNLAIQSSTDLTGASQNRFHLTANLAGAPEAQPLDVAFNWHSESSAANGKFATWDATVQTGNLPLSAISPFLSRLSPDLDLSGTITSDVRLEVKGDAASIVSRPAAGKWQISTHDLQITWPSRLGDDRLALEQAEFQGDFASDGASCRVDRLALATDVCKFDGSGTIPLVDVAETNEKKAAAGKPAETKFTLRGDLDLVALAKLLPQTVAMREGAKLTEGKVKYEVTTRTSEGKTFWTGRVDTTRICAEIGEEKIAWDEPLRFEFDAHREKDHLGIDSVECRSDLLHLTGRGNSGNLHVEAECDLDRLAARMGDFFGPDFREMHGKLGSTLDAHRDADGLFVFDAESTVDKLLIRQKVKTMAECRRGDVQQVEFQAPAPPPASPAPPPGLPVDRRTMRLQRRADRVQQRETRRREAEAIKKADEVILVPVEEWRTMWSEPHLVLTTQGRFVADKMTIELTKFDAVTDGVHVAAAGQMTGPLSQCNVDVKGESTLDMERVVDRLSDVLGPHVQLSGTETREFSVRGPLWLPPARVEPGSEAAAPLPADAVVPGSLAPPPLVPLELKAATGFAWKSGNLFGLDTGPGELRFTLSEGIVSMSPFELMVSGGKLKLAPQLLLNEGPARIKFPAGTIVDNIELTDEICDCWLKYVAPILSQATRSEGRFSVDLGETRLPLADPPSGMLSGHLRIAKGQVMPGPIFAEISKIIGNIVSAIDGNPPRDFVGLDRPLVQINGQDVAFKLEKRRIYHTPLDFKFRNMIVRTEGSVGEDESLDVVATVYFSDDLVALLPMLSQFREHPLQMPIRGTLRKPELDPQARAALIQKLVPNAIQGIIQKFQQRNP